MAEKHEKTLPLPGMDVFKKATDEQLNRIGQLLDESSKMQAKWVEASSQSMEETSAFAKTSIKYVNDLSAEWQRISMESTRKAMEFFAR